ncbi:hypothetical protein [Rhizobium sp. PEPV16]|uniref:hypothetical protein n=1 Tax=Rhizobium sp. PEPV16 TaxID=1820614 RepID=UPI00124DB90E|nr:hypothetical protein [Rhizobium sp. PEPV16]KAF5882152.1 hypothetical protein FY112_26935 [Rhizobium sp. PEPV16]
MGGETSDYLAVPDLLAMPVKRPRRLVVDKGYDAISIRQELLFLRHQIASELDREELASSITYYYQTGVRSEGTLIRLLA